MTRQLEALKEQRQAKQDSALLKAVDYELEGAIGRNGGTLNGFSVKFGDEDYLVTLRATFPAGAQIAFVGGSTLGGVLVKAVREAMADRLSWREDRFRGSASSHGAGS